MAGRGPIEELEAQLRADPDDQDAWLVYKDWLLAQGDPRGELIGHDNAAAKPWFRGRVTESRYGFAIGVSVSIDAVGIEAVAEALLDPEARLITRLEIAATEVAASALADLATLDLGCLAVLKIRYGAVGAAGVRALMGCSTLRNLHTLDLRYGRVGNDGAIALARAEQLADVRTLALQRNDIGEAGAIALATSAWLRPKSLDLRYNPIGLAGARALAESPNGSCLSRLLLDRADIGAAGVRALADSPYLPAVTRGYWSAA